MIKFILTLCFVLIPLFSVEEKNLISFFKINGKINKLKYKLKEIQLCKIKTKDIILINEYNVEECYFLEKNLTSKLKEIIAEHPKKNEIQLLFLRDQKLKMMPTLESNNMLYSVHSILFYKKTKTFHFELLKEPNEYYYFRFDPDQVQIENVE